MARQEDRSDHMTVEVHAHTDLVLLKLDAAGRLDLEQPSPLGTPVEVREFVRVPCAFAPST